MQDVRAVGVSDTSAFVLFKVLATVFAKDYQCDGLLMDKTIASKFSEDPSCCLHIENKNKNKKQPLDHKLEEVIVTTGIHSETTLT